MKESFKDLAFDHIEKRLETLRPLHDEMPPHQGWIKTLRQVLNMTVTQLAVRMGIAQSAVTRLEQREQEGAVTLKTMQMVAEALGGKLVYGIVFPESLTDLKNQQAKKKAKKILQDLTHTMALESQEPHHHFLKDQEKRLMNEMLHSKRLWDPS